MSKGFDMQGYLKVSVSAIKDSQAHTDHGADEEEEEEEGDLASRVIMPPGVKMAPYRLSCYIYKGKDLPKCDLFAWCDGFIKVNYAGSENTTDVIENTDRPEWNEELILPVMTPCMADAIEISLWDDDGGLDADFIGTCFYSWKELMDKRIIGPHWAHLYGWPDEADEEEILEYSKVMKPFVYKGSVLLGFEVEEDKDARLGKKKAVKVEEPETVEYELRFDLFQVAELPVEDEEIYIDYGLGPYKDIEDNLLYKKTDDVELVGNSSDVWLTDRRLGRLDLRVKWPLIKKSNVYHEKQVPDLFVNVMLKKGFGEPKRIGYLRFEYDLKKARELMKGGIQWHTLLKDPFSGMKILRFNP